MNILDGIRKVAGSRLREAIGIKYAPIDPMDMLRYAKDDSAHLYKEALSDHTRGGMSVRDGIRAARARIANGEMDSVWQMYFKKDPGAATGISKRLRRPGRALGIIQLSSGSPGKEADVGFSLLNKKLRKKGLGSKMYGEVMRRHPILNSDSTMNSNSFGTWEHFLKRQKPSGLSVQKMVPVHPVSSRYGKGYGDLFAEVHSADNIFRAAPSRKSKIGKFKAVNLNRLKKPSRLDNINDFIFNIRDKTDDLSDNLEIKLRGQNKDKAELVGEKFRRSSKNLRRAVNNRAAVGKKPLPSYDKISRILNRSFKNSWREVSPTKGKNGLKYVREILNIIRRSPRYVR